VFRRCRRAGKYAARAAIIEIPAMPTLQFAAMPAPPIARSPDRLRATDAHAAGQAATVLFTPLPARCAMAGRQRASGSHARAAFIRVETLSNGSVAMRSWPPV